MKTVFLFWFLSSLVSSMTPVEFGQQMESEMPGSVAYVHRWAIMDKSIDRIESIFLGRASPPRGERALIATAYYTLSTDPEMTDEKFQNHISRIFGENDLVPWKIWKSDTLRLLSVPRWFFTKLFFLYHSGESHPNAIRAMYRFVRNYSSSESLSDPRFTDDVSIRKIVKLWWLFGLPSDPEGSFPCHFDLETDSYVMSHRTKQLALQHLSIVSLR